MRKHPRPEQYGRITNRKLLIQFSSIFLHKKGQVLGRDGCFLINIASKNENALDTQLLCSAPDKKKEEKIPVPL